MNHSGLMGHRKAFESVTGVKTLRSVFLKDIGVFQLNALLVKMPLIKRHIKCVV